MIKTGELKGPDIKPHSSGTLKIDLPELKNVDVLYLKVLDPENRELWTWSWDLNRNDFLTAFEKTAAVKIQEKDDETVVITENQEFHFNKTNGYLEKITKGDKTMSFGNGPQFVAFRRADRSLDGWVAENLPKGVDRLYNIVPSDSTLVAFTTEMVDGKAVITAQYFGALKKVQWEIGSEENVKLNYEYDYDGVVELMGIKFDYPEQNVKSKKWLGEGPYRVWQNRLQGTKLNIWKNDYNDPIPGETFTYPEFKGYFGNWHWVKFETTEGSITMAIENPDKYLGVYTPRDGRDALLYTFRKVVYRYSMLFRRFATK